MIKIKVNYDDGYVKDFKIAGHANFADYGKDIVCASVSSIVITSVNLALMFDSKSVCYNEKEGFINVEVIRKDKNINKVFENMINMLKDLEQQYNKNIKFI